MPDHPAVGNFFINVEFMDQLKPGKPNTCLNCSKPIKGRSDKKFCDDYCRNNFNNHLKSEEGGFTRSINNILRNNRKILGTMIMLGEGTVKSIKSKLLEKGFNFQYFTHIYTNKKGLTYFFCYEYGYLFLDSDWILIVKRKEL